MGKSNKFLLTTKSHSSTRVNPYDKITMNALNVSCPDKQITLPKLESNGAQLIFIELYSLFIFIIALGTQYLNIHRSFWWLSPKARSQQALNHNHLILDSDVSQFSLIFIGQSSMITILRALMNKTTIPSKLNYIFAQQYYYQKLLFNSSSSSSTPPSSTLSDATATTTANNVITNGSHKQNNNNINQQQLQNNQYQQPPPQSIPSGQTSAAATLSRQPSTTSQTLSAHQQQQAATVITTIVTSAASWVCSYYMFKCAYRIWTNSGLNGLSFVLYPIVFSMILNSTHILQVFESCCKTGKIDLSFLTLSMTLFSTHIKFDDDKLCHQCSNQPDEIRDEVERLRTIFNDRLKFVLQKSILLAYYSSFVPICFAQSFLYYDHTWTLQHVLITWFSSLIMLISSSYMPHFYDVVHRSAYHFGKWQKLEARNTLVPCINWSENVIYPQGVVVKHYRGYFRSESVSNCAQPGVSSHLRYYIVFSNPSIGYAAALALLGILLTIQMYLLLVSTEWYKLIAMMCMMLINISSIFRLVKSLVVIAKIYRRKR